MCCRECCTTRDPDGAIEGFQGQIDQVWTELDALRQEREEARKQLWAALNALEERVIRRLTELSD